jgi:hypothetical protein
MRTRSSYRHPHTHLARTLRNGAGEHSVDADGDQCSATNEEMPSNMAGTGLKQTTPKPSKEFFVRRQPRLA